jgi:hypothetical protein
MRGLLLVELMITLSLIALFSAYTLQGWQHQQQRLVLEDSSSALLSNPNGQPAVTGVSGLVSSRHSGYVKQHPYTGYYPT